jgi:translation initiation factor IF-2
VKKEDPARKSDPVKKEATPSAADSLPSPDKPHPATFRPDAKKTPAPGTKKAAPAAKTGETKKDPPAKKAPEPSRASGEPVKSTTPASAVRTARTLAPKWTPPAMKSSPSVASSSALTPSPRIGLRVGLSRNYKPVKPLHASFKLPD